MADRLVRNLLSTLPTWEKGKSLTHKEKNMPPMKVIEVEGQYYIVEGTKRKVAGPVGSIPELRSTASAIRNSEDSEHAHVAIDIYERNSGKQQQQAAA